MKDGASAIIIHNKKVLLFLRDDIPTIRFPNYWSLVGGQKESGETFDQTIRRELVEEISYAPKNLKLLGQFQYPNIKEKVTARLYIAFIKDQEVQKIKHTGDEGQMIKYFRLDEILKLKITPLVKAYLLRYYKVFEKVIEESYIPKPEEIGLEAV